MHWPEELPSGLLPVIFDCTDSYVIQTPQSLGHNIGSCATARLIAHSFVEQVPTMLGLCAIHHPRAEGIY